MFVSIKYESPITLPEAHRLGINGDLAQLVVGLGRSPHQPDLPVLARLILQGRANSADVVLITAINEFRSLADIEAKAPDVEFQRVPRIRGLRVGNADSLAWVLERWSAESLVLVEGNEDQLVSELGRVRENAPPFWKLSTGSDRDEYLAILRTTPAVYYFSQSHGSIEMVGRPGVVRTALKRAVEAAEEDR